MKKVTRFLSLCLIITLALSGCAGNSGKVQSPNEIGAEGTETAESIAQEMKESKESDETMTFPDVNVSAQKVSVPYAGEQFEKSVFAAGGEMLYVCGLKANSSHFLGCMKKEEDIFQEFTVETEEGMRAFNMVVDEKERCHILWMSVEKINVGGQLADSITYEKSYITIVNNQGELEKKTDVTDLFSGGYRRPFSFAVDRDENYYFESEKEIVQIKSDGSRGTVFAGEGWIEGIGMGKSGAVYCTYQQENGEQGLGKLEGESIVPCDCVLPRAAAVYAGVYAGTDTELMLFNKESGALVYDGESVGVRVSGTDLPVRGQEIVGYGALADGRMCIMAGEKGAYVFHYIPVGK